MLIENPYRPGAGHTPPFLAGRATEQYHFKRMLQQSVITENLLITGLRGYGKTVLLDHMKGLADTAGWLWVGNDLSESSTLSEDRLAQRILTDVAAAMSQKIASLERNAVSGKVRPIRGMDPAAFSFSALMAGYEAAPGLPSDRLKQVLASVTALVQSLNYNGLILAYDEAQCLSDKAEQDQFPLSMLVETVSALQRRSEVAPCMLVLCGLPQIFDALTATRTYTERMFHVMTLERLSRDDTTAAVMTPLRQLMPPLRCGAGLIDKVVSMTGGYPYLIQFFGKELVEQMLENGGTLSADQFPSAQTFERLDAGLFSARWNRTTDKQRELLGLIARRPREFGTEFSAQELEMLRGSRDEASGNISATLVALCERGMLYRTRHGRYAFTVPLSEAMITRRLKREQSVVESWEPAESKIDPARTMPPPLPAGKAAARKAQKWSWFR